MDPGEGFETGLLRSLNLFAPAITTRDTVLLGFGVEQLGSAGERVALLRKAFASVGLR